MTKEQFIKDFSDYLDFIEFWVDEEDTLNKALEEFLSFKETWVLN